MKFNSQSAFIVALLGLLVDVMAKRLGNHHHISLRHSQKSEKLVEIGKSNQPRRLFAKISSKPKKSSETPSTNNSTQTTSNTTAAPAAPTTPAVTPEEKEAQKKKAEEDYKWKVEEAADAITRTEALLEKQKEDGKLEKERRKAEFNELTKKSEDQTKNPNLPNYNPGFSSQKIEYEKLNKKKPYFIENSNWINVGYNILYGNPIAAPKSEGMLDPGFENQIFKLETRDDKTTFDQYYKYPVGYSVQGVDACNTGFTASAISTQKELQKEMSVRIGARASKFGFSFAANGEYAQMSKELNSNNKQYISVNAVCATYRVRLDRFNPPDFTENFIRGLKSIQDTEYLIDDTDSLKVYDEFFSEFGTHYLEEILMGSKYTYIEEVDYKATSSSESKSLGIDANIEYKSVVSSARLSASYQDGTSEATSSRDSSQNKFITVIGAPMPTDFSIEKWLASSKEKVAPIEYKTNSYVELLTMERAALNLRMFSLDPVKIKENLEKGINNYCLATNKIYKTEYECQPFAKNYIEKQNFQEKSHKINNIYDMSHLDISCRNDEVLNYIKFSPVSTSATEFLTVSYRCIKTDLLGECQTKFSPYKEVSKDFNLSWASITALGPIQCEDNSVLSQFVVLHSNSEKSIRWQYKCCNLKNNGKMDNTVEITKPLVLSTWYKLCTDLKESTFKSNCYAVSSLEGMEFNGEQNHGLFSLNFQLLNFPSSKYIKMSFDALSIEKDSSA